MKPFQGAALGLAMVLAPARLVSAQNADDASVSISVVGDGLTVTKTVDMDFGSHPAGGTIRSSDVDAVAQWDVLIAAAGDYNYSFSVPTVLTGTGGSVPITFTHAIVASMATGMGYLVDVNTGGTVSYDGSGPLVVQMGPDYDLMGSGVVSVNLGAAQAGTYTGTVTLTVAVP